GLTKTGVVRPEAAAEPRLFQQAGWFAPPSRPDHSTLAPPACDRDSLPRRSVPSWERPVRKDDGAMSLISRIRDIVRSWRRRRGGPRAAMRTSVAMELLDHRQLLSVNFTGNVVTDFPASQQPGVVVLPDNPNVLHPVIPPALQNLVKVSGFDVSGLR